MARVITVTSGKGGVGKTSISLNLSLSLASRGYKVCLFDADLGLANVNILTGIYPSRDLKDVLEGRCRLDEIIITQYHGIDIIPGSSGVEKLADLTPPETANLIQMFKTVDDYDFFIFDTSAGISSQVISFCMASNEIILVATCEPTSITDAYSMLKVLSKHSYANQIQVIINQIKTGKAAKNAYNKLKGTANKFLKVKLQPLGLLPTDNNVRAAVASQTPFIIKFPDTLASKCLNNIIEKLIQTPDNSADYTLSKFWSQCISFIETNYSSGDKSNPSELPKNADISKIDEKLSALTQEIGNIKKILVSHTAALEKIYKYAARNINQQPAAMNPGPADITLQNEQEVTRGKLRSPTLHELKNWDEDTEPVVKLHLD